MSELHEKSDAICQRSPHFQGLLAPKIQTFGFYTTQRLLIEFRQGMLHYFLYMSIAACKKGIDLGPHSCELSTRWRVLSHVFRQRYRGHCVQRDYLQCRLDPPVDHLHRSKILHALPCHQELWLG